MPETTHDLLKKIVAETKGPPGWSFRVRGEPGNLTLFISVAGVDNYDAAQMERAHANAQAVVIMKQAAEVDRKAETVRCTSLEVAAERSMRARIANDLEDRADEQRGDTFAVGHCHPVPNTTYNEATWRRWIFEQCLRTFTHELGEQLGFGAERETMVRPFAPMHGPGCDPYTVHEWISEEAALTKQDGTLRPGPV